MLNAFQYIGNLALKLYLQVVKVKKNRVQW